MYLPASELQQYKGQLTCPYCIMDMRDEDRKRDQPHPEESKFDKLPYIESCERCGRDLHGKVYILNDKKLCKSCVDDEKNKWELVSGAPTGPGQRISLTPIKNKKKTDLITFIISETLYVLQLKKRPVVREITVYNSKMPIGVAKPMAEERATIKKEETKPETEGLMAIKSTLVPVKSKTSVEKPTTAKSTKSKKPKRTKFTNHTGPTKKV